MGALCLWGLFYALWGLYLLVHVSYCSSRDSWLRYLPKGLAINWFPVGRDFVVCSFLVRVDRVHVSNPVLSEQLGALLFSCDQLGSGSSPSAIKVAVVSESSKLRNVGRVQNRFRILESGLG